MGLAYDGPGWGFELRDMFENLRRNLTEALRLALAGLRVMLFLAWSAIKPLLVAVLQVLAALVLLFEEWGWKPLSDALAWLARFPLLARLEALISRLPPYAALLVFALPTAILLPVKLAAMWLLAQGQVATATATFIAAKIASTALVARIFILTRPSLMRIGWFASAYNWFIPWKDRLFAEIRASWVWRYGRMVKTRVRHEIKQAWASWAPGIRSALSRMSEEVRAIWHRYFGSSM
jgi:hypothetical protein